MELASRWRQNKINWNINPKKTIIKFIFRPNVKNLESLSTTPKLPLITQTNESKQRKQLTQIITHEVARAGWLISY